RNLRDDLVNSFKPKEPNSFEQCAELLDSETFGGLNPLTASRIFRVLLEHSEACPHVVKNEGRTRPEVQEA
ncbi:MAG TPA: hypothetical protein VIK76_04165, partial [Pyrinomonadaceae bacterium]